MDVPERAAGEIIDLICTEAGELLYDHYLQRKSFPFASELVNGALTAQLQMAFVPHDQGEMDGEELWGIEDEPQPAPIDTWASMQLEVRRPVVSGKGSDGDATPARTSQGFSKSARSTMRSTVRSKSNKEKELPKEEPRSIQLPEQVHEDVEEERIRESKRQDDLKRRERERRAREAEKLKEEEMAKIVALHEEMDRRPHTFDSQGNLIWIEPPKVDKLPKVNEDFAYNIRKDPKTGTTFGMDTFTETMKLGEREGSRSQKLRKASKSGKLKDPSGDHKFTDFFSRLQHNQPPVLETMGVAAGVTLESMGRRKQGQPNYSEQRQMSRMEYVMMAERELGIQGDDAGHQASMESETRSAAGRSAAGSAARSLEAAAAAAPPAAPPKAAAPKRQASGHDLGADAQSRPPRAAHANTAPPANLAAAAAEAAAPAPQAPSGGGTTLPPIQQRGPPPQQRGPAPPAMGSGAYPRGGMAPAPAIPPSPSGGGDDETKVLQAPVAPSKRTRGLKTFQALGYQRPPRFHAAELGGQMGTGIAQPPIGATMGHGLVRTSSEAAYYFPSQAPGGNPLVKSGSEGSLQGLSKGSAPSRRSLMGEELPGGRLLVEKSKAYQDFRKSFDPQGGGTSVR